MLHKDKVAIVTGGASGIGRATALAFAGEGAKVVIADLNTGGGETVVAEIHAAGGVAIFIRTDVTISADVQAMVNCAVNTFGGLDIAFNNAGTPGANGTVVDLDEAEWRRTMAINVDSVFFGMKYQIPAMIARGGGAIVHTASGMGLFALPNVSGYIASKHAVMGLTKSAAVDFGPSKIRVNALCPGKTLTPMMRAQGEALNIRLEDIAARAPLRRLGEAEDQAEAVVWICSEKASFITGLALIVDGGEAVLR